MNICKYMLLKPMLPQPPLNINNVIIFLFRGKDTQMVFSDNYVKARSLNQLLDQTQTSSFIKHSEHRLSAYHTAPVM